MRGSEETPEQNLRAKAAVLDVSSGFFRPFLVRNTRKRTMKVVKLRITLVDGRFKYDAEAIEASGRYYYRIGATTIEVTKNEFNRVLANPRLYYFSTALKLHKLIEKGLRKNVHLSANT
jgi:hypothetical protein